MSLWKEKDVSLWHILSWASAALPCPHTPTPLHTPSLCTCSELFSGVCWCLFASAQCIIFIADCLHCPHSLSSVSFLLCLKKKPKIIILHSSSSTLWLYLCDIMNHLFPTLHGMTMSWHTDHPCSTKCNENKQKGYLKGRNSPWRIEALF